MYYTGMHYQEESASHGVTYVDLHILLCCAVLLLRFTTCCVAVR